MALGTLIDINKNKNCIYIDFITHVFVHGKTVKIAKYP